MIILLKGEVEPEMAQQLVYALNNLQKEEKLDVYLSSSGGSVFVAELILDLVNRHKDKITLYGYGDISSSAFDLFFLSECEKILVGNPVGMYHQSTVEIRVNEHKTPQTNYDKMRLRLEADVYRKITTDTCKLTGMTSKETKEINRGLDVYFTPIRMKEMLNYARNNSRNV